MFITALNWFVMCVCFVKKVFNIFAENVNDENKW